MIDVLSELPEASSFSCFSLDLLSQLYLEINNIGLLNFKDDNYRYFLYLYH